MKTGTLLIFLFVSLASNSILAQNSSLLTDEIRTLIIKKVAYPETLLLNNTSTIAVLKLAIIDNVVINVRLSDSADSLYKKDFNQHRQELLTGLTKIFAAWNLQSVTILIPLYIYVINPKEIFSVKEYMVSQMFLFDGFPYNGQATIFPAIYFKTYSIIN